MSDTPTAVRILPMDAKEEPDFAGLTAEDAQRQYFLGKLVRTERPPGKYWYRKKGLDALSGTLVLFQFDTRIIASAILDHRERLPKPEGPYHGALYFKVDSIRVFDPVGLKVIQAIWPNVTSFGRTKWKLDPKGVSAFEQQLTGVEVVT